MFSQVFLATALTAANPLLTAVKLAPDAPFAALLNAALPVAVNQGDELPLGTQLTKKAFIAEPGQSGGYLVTCVTTFLPGRSPQGIKVFDGCQIEEQSEAEPGVPTLTFKELTLKLGGQPALPVPGTVFCHTRAC